MKLKTFKDFSLNESVDLNESEITTDKQFKEYAETVLKKAFGQEYDQKKADEVSAGCLNKAKGDYGKAIGMLTQGLTEEVNEGEFLTLNQLAINVNDILDDNEFTATGNKLTDDEIDKMKFDTDKSNIIIQEDLELFESDEDALSEVLNVFTAFQSAMKNIKRDPQNGVLMVGKQPVATILVRLTKIVDTYNKSEAADLKNNIKNFYSNLK